VIIVKGGEENQNMNIPEMRASDPNTQKLLEQHKNKIIQRITFFDKLGGKFTGKTSERGMTNAKHALDSMNHFQQPPNNMVVCIGGKLIKIIF